MIDCVPRKSIPIGRLLPAQRLHKGRCTKGCSRTCEWHTANASIEALHWKIPFFYWKAHWPQKAQWRSESLAQPHRETHLALLIPSLPNGLQRRRWVPFNQLVHSIVPLLHPAPFMMDGGINKKEMVHICIWFASPNENDINYERQSMRRDQQNQIKTLIYNKFIHKIKFTKLNRFCA